MKKSRFASLLLFLFCISLINSQVHVRGYFRKDGTYVSPHIRSSPDGIKENNYSYKSPSTNYYPSSNSSYNSSYYILTNNNFANLQEGFSYNITNSNGEVLAKVVSTSKYYYHVYDNNHNYIGFVKVNKRRTKYKAYNLDGNLVSTNKRYTIWYIIFFGACLGGGILLGNSMTPY
jgi:hypothetical protein